MSKTVLGKRLRCVLAGALIGAAAAGGQPPSEELSIDATAAATPFPHFWEQTFGSGRAVLALRETYRDDLRAVHAVTGFRNVRFHAILHDEIGVYNEDAHGNPIYNFALVDQIYDGLLKNGVRPFVEISFMPRKLAFNPDGLHAFWYRPDVTPPKDIARWNDLIEHFAQHLIDRYGIDEVSQWYFEVWNEPNIDFFVAVPQQANYFALYAATARTLKAVSPRLRVGGPATSAANWIPDFLAYVAKEHVPVDFISTHGYADDSEQEMLGTHIGMAKDDRVCAAVTRVKRDIRASALPTLPLFWTEWNVQGERNSRDTIFVGPALANTIRACDGQAEMMSFWTFSDVFEEGGPAPQPFEGGFGLRAKGNINKPSFYDFALLHQLGNERLAADSRNVIVTRNSNGALVLAAWNLVDPENVAKLPAGPHGATPVAAGTQGPTRTIRLHFEHVPPDARVTVARVDATHGNVLPAYYAMGAPLDPTDAQSEEMNRQTELPPPEQLRLSKGTLQLTMTPNTLALITVTK